MARNKTVFPSFRLCESEKEAREWCESTFRNYTPYMKRAYKKPHYLAHEIRNNDGKGNSWHGFIVWYYYHRG